MTVPTNCSYTFEFSNTFKDDYPTFILFLAYIIVSNVLASVMRRHWNSLPENSVNLNILVNMYIVELANIFSTTWVNCSQHFLKTQIYVIPFSTRKKVEKLKNVEKFPFLANLEGLWTNQKDFPSHVKPPFNQGS